MHQRIHYRGLFEYEASFYFKQRASNMRIPPNTLGQSVTQKSCIGEVRGLNFGWDTDCTDSHTNRNDQTIRWFSSFCPDKYHFWTLLFTGN